MSLSFLFVVLIILGITVAILAFREPLAEMVSSSPTTEPVATPGTDTLLPVPSPAQQGNDSLIIDGGEPVVPKPSTDAPRPSPQPTPQAVSRPSPSPERSENLNTAQLYFIRVRDDGSMVSEKTTRSIRFGDSPLVASLTALLRGPNTDELNAGLISMIPAGTSLLSAWVRDGTAFLNFNESFMFNPLGADGMRSQVWQIVLSATEFPTVDSVQILIEGKKVDYLGGDGVFAGRPISRTSLP